MSLFLISEERRKIQELLDQPVDSMGCLVVRWSDWQARRIYKSQIPPKLGINLKNPDYTGQQTVEEMDEVGKRIDVNLQFAGYDVPGYDKTIFAVSQRQTIDGLEIQGVELRKFGQDAFPTHLHNLKRV